MDEYQYVDYTNTYSRIMQFNKNKYVPIHRWYPFVEGYSAEFISSIIYEVGISSGSVCLDPFSGSGTSTVEFQNRGISCYSFEVNPLMYIISKAKLETYSFSSVYEYFLWIKNWNGNIELFTRFSTLVERPNISKWNFNLNVWKEVVRLRTAIYLIESEKYRNLFTVALASILLDVSNLYRNGKCLSYKRNWQSLNTNEYTVRELFEDKVHQILEDIKCCSRIKLIENKKKLYNIDSRVGICKFVPNESIDLVVTSPPYLNSRDYTDTYMLELKALELTPSADSIINLRKNTLRSHVQIKWNDIRTLDNHLFNAMLEELNSRACDKKSWNNSILDMVRLYFVDIDTLFCSLGKKVKKGGLVYFNVSNSAYFGYTINTLEICASIAESNGFYIKEIRKARYLKTSPQQKMEVGNLLEGVIVMMKR